MTKRRKILDHNRAIREGRADKPTRLPDGEVAFRIPTSDMPVLVRLFPDLAHKDGQVQRAAWDKFRHHPLAEQYLVQRTPSQVKRSPGGIIIK